MAEKPRIAIFDTLHPRESSFMRPLAAHLEDAWQVDYYHPGSADELAGAATEADVLWFEWCLQQPCYATNQLDFRDKKVIIRLHLFEAMDTNYPAMINWDNVDHLILVCEDMREIMRIRFPQLPSKLDIRVIYNAIECNRYASTAPKKMTDIAWVARIIMKKNPGMFLQIMAKLVAIDPAYRLHIAGVGRDLLLQRYIDSLIGKLGLGQHIVFYDFVEDMPTWLQDKGVLLSTALYESFGMSIGEAMAAGAFPVIHNFPGADQLWPRECLYSTVDEAVELIRLAAPGKYVDFVRERYDAPIQFAATDALLAAPNCKKGTQQRELEIPQSRTQLRMRKRTKRRDNDG